MNTNFASSLGVCAVAIGISVFVFMRNDPTPPEIAVVKPAAGESLASPHAAEITDFDSEDASLKSQIALLKNQVQELRRDVRAQRRTLNDRFAQQPGSAGNSLDPRIAPILYVTEESTQREHQAIDSIALHFDDAIVAQGEDRRGRDGWEQEASNYFASRGLDSIWINAVECSKSLCRMIVSHDSGDEADALMDAVGNGPLGSGSFFHQSEDGEETIIYAARAGYDDNFQWLLQSAMSSLQP